uniref:ARAD1C08074p n=1 Tax=Blastobotrys adeninivorans TaxID=409370 RepID=A0A060T5U4_BLAAD
MILGRVQAANFISPHQDCDMALVKFKHLVSAPVDILIGISIGVTAFVLFERRENRPKEHRLLHLIGARVLPKPQTVDVGDKDMELDQVINNISK